MEAFLKQLLFIEGGVFTLFGDKPMTDMLIYQGSENDICLDGLSEESLQNLSYKEDRTLQYWNAWRAFSEKRALKNYRILAHPCPTDPSYFLCSFIHLGHFQAIYEKHKSLFDCLMRQSTSFESILAECENPDSLFWSRLHDDHYLRGIIYGYGEENARYFTQLRGISTPHFSTEGESPSEPIPLPVFALSAPDIIPNQPVENYKQQREVIKQLYGKEDFLDATLRYLYQND